MPKDVKSTPPNIALIAKILKLFETSYSNGLRYNNLLYCYIPNTTHPELISHIHWAQLGKHGLLNWWERRNQPSMRPMDQEAALANYLGRIPVALPAQGKKCNLVLSWGTSFQESAPGFEQTSPRLYDGIRKRIFSHFSFPTVFSERRQSLSLILHLLNINDFFIIWGE